MTDASRTSIEHPIIWSSERRETGSRRRPVDIPFRTFEYLFFCEKQLKVCSTRSFAFKIQLSDFSVDYDSIDEDDISDIHKQLIKKHGTK